MISTGGTIRPLLITEVFDVTVTANMGPCVIRSIFYYAVPCMTKSQLLFCKLGYIIYNIDKTTCFIFSVSLAPPHAPLYMLSSGVKRNQCYALILVFRYRMQRACIHYCAPATDRWKGNGTKAVCLCVVTVVYNASCIDIYRSATSGLKSWLPLA